MRIARLTLTTCFLAAAAIVSAQQPVSRGASGPVRLFVTVTDRDGRLVSDLTQDQFEVRDEGLRQPIAVFDNSPQPIQLVVMLDVSGGMEANLSLMRGAAEQLFRRLRPDDRVRVGSFGYEITIAPTFTNDFFTLRQALPSAIRRGAPSPLWRALDEAIGVFDPESGERRVVLMLSGGRNSTPTGMRHISQPEVTDRARAENVMVYAIAMRGLARRTTPIGPSSLQQMMLDELPDPAIEKVAEETGGGYTEIFVGQNLGAAFAGVANELHRQYLIGFDPPKRDGKRHDIEVRVNQRGLRPRAPRSYIAPTS